MVFQNSVYDKLKWVAMYLLPALATLYGTLASIWNLPYGEQIVATISALDLFLAAILGISKKSYNSMLDNVPEREEDFDDKGEDD